MTSGVSSSWRARTFGRSRRNKRRTEPVRRIIQPITLRQAALAVVSGSVPVLVGLAVVAVGGAAGIGARLWMTTSPRFAIESISVGGNRALDRQAVTRAMGLAGGENIFGVDLDQLERALEANPWVIEATVQRRLPDELRVDLVERAAVGVAEIGSLYLVDRDGCAFKVAAVDRGEGVGLPVVTGIERAAYTADVGRACTRIRTALDVHARYSAATARPPVGEINTSEHHGVTLYTRDGAIEIRLGKGTTSQLARRLTAFDAAWSALSAEERQTARVIHVNRDTTPQRVSVAFAQAHAQAGTQQWPK